MLDERKAPMAETPQVPVESAATLVIGGGVLVALSTPLNLILQLFCWDFIASTASPYAADNSGGGLVMFAGFVNVGLYLALCGLAGLIFRQSSPFRQKLAIFVVIVLHLGFWLGWSFALVTAMAATGAWL